MGTVQYHLNLLEKHGRITFSRRGLRKHYFLSGAFREEDKRLLEILTHETAREILLFIIEQREPTQSDIVNRIGVSAPSISWHLSRLVDTKVVMETREGRHKRYALRGDPKRVVSLLKTHFPSFWNRWSDRLAELFLSLSRVEKP